MDTQNTEREGRVIGASALGDVQDLHPDTSREVKLTAETKVLCINRGVEVVRDTFDSRHYRIPPGYFSTEYGAACHFKARAVVPGSRNPETGQQASFIAIIGIAAPTADGLKVQLVVDDPVDWDPFTPEERRLYGMAVEAIDRDSLVDPIDPQVEIVPLAGNARPGDGSGQGSRIKPGATPTTGARRKPQIEGTGTAALKGRNAPGDNEATRMIAGARAEQSGAQPPAPEPEGPDLGQLTGAR